MSMIEEIGHFLIPGNDPIQLTFFVIISLAVLLSVGFVVKNAKEQNWQQNWLHGAAEGEQAGLTADHGSAAELSQAIATKAEKIAVIMPGMLLILGLLGTFLGLGLALDKASDILQNSGNSVGAMDSSMQDLMNMMQGLGTKFKTSTWGIIAFILLKVWESLYGFEERRLSWCINKMKEVMNLSRQQRNEEQQQQSLQQQENRHAASQLIVEALSAQTASLRNESAAQITALHEAFATQTTTLRDEMLVQTTTLRDEIAVQTAALNEGVAVQMTTLRDEFALQAKRAEESDVLRHQHQLAVLNEIAGINEQSRALLHTYTSSSVENLAALQRAAGTMSDASQQVAGSASSLQRVVDTLGTELASVMQGVRDELSQVVNTMNADFNRNIQQMSGQLAESSAEMGHTMLNIERSLSASIGNMDQAFSRNIKEMNHQLAQSSAEMGRTMQNIEHSLSDSIGNMDLAFSSNIKEMSHQLTKSSAEMSRTMSDVERSLSSSIGNMDQAFSDNMRQMATSLTGATGEISHSVNSMSAQIDRTMNEVSEQTEKAAKIQRRAMDEFSTTSDELNAQVREMTNYINKVTDEIKLGLTAVSNSNQHTKSLLKHFDEIVQAQKDLPVVLSGVAQQMETLQQETRQMLQFLAKKTPEALPTL